MYVRLTGHGAAKSDQCNKRMAHHRWRGSLPLAPSQRCPRQLQQLTSYPSILDAWVVGWLGAAKAQLPAHALPTESGRPGVPRGSPPGSWPWVVRCGSAHASACPAGPPSSYSRRTPRRHPRMGSTPRRCGYRAEPEHLLTQMRHLAEQVATMVV